MLSTCGSRKQVENFAEHYNLFHKNTHTHTYTHTGGQLHACFFTLSISLEVGLGCLLVTLGVFKFNVKLFHSYFKDKILKMC